MRIMKDSGVEWIGNIPEEWELIPLRSILNERKESNAPIKTHEVLSLTIEQGVIPYSEKVSTGGNKPKEDISKYKLAYPGDIVINSMNVLAGAVGISKYFGAVSLVYYTLYPKNENVSAEYFNHVFQTKPFQENLLGLGNGIMIKKSESSGKLNTIRMRIPMSKFRLLMLPTPNINEQNQISSYINKKVVMINNIIEKTKESIEEYKKYKQSLITEIVTKGLNPNVKMKDSGIEWIGEIPEHWKVRKLKDFSEISRGTVDKSIKENELPVYLVQYKNVYKRREQHETDSDYLPITVTEAELLKSKVLQGDMLLTASSETSNDIGHSTVIFDNLPNHVFGSDILRIRISESVMNIVFKKFFIENYICLHRLDSLCRGITRFRFSMDDFKTLFYVLPPLCEQDQIGKFLDRKCQLIDKSINSKQLLIKELESYKKSLIYEVVTGKKEIN